jgi:hypothetical protein
LSVPEPSAVPKFDDPDSAILAAQKKQKRERDQPELTLPLKGSVIVADHYTSARLA